MIVRILGDGQFDLPDEMTDALNVLDAEVEVAVDGNDEAAFGHALTALVEFVHHNGTSLPDDDLRPSDAVLPPADALLEEVRDLFNDDGLIPG